MVYKRQPMIFLEFLVDMNSAEVRNASALVS